MIRTETSIALSPFSVGRKPILIGANCLDLRVGSLSFGEGRVINPYPDHQAVVRAAEYCWETALRTSHLLGTRLGEIHGVSRSQAYWEALLLPFLVAWVENLYDRYLRLKEVRDTTPGARLEISKVPIPPALYAKSRDIWEHAPYHSINIQIYLLLIEAMGLSGSLQPLDSAGGSPDRRATQGFLAKYKGMILRHVRPLVHPNPFAQAGLPWDEPKEDALKDDGFDRLTLARRRLRLDGGADEFERVLGALMPWSLPISLFEEYRARSFYVERLARRRRLQALCVSYTIWLNDSIKYLVGCVKDSGARIVGRQHGAGYGSFELVAPERVERRLADLYVSWGWTDDRICPALPLPEPRLSAIQDTHAATNENIYFISSQAPMYMFRYQSYWLPEFVLSGYWSMQESFFCGLTQPIRDSILFRAFPIEYGWGERGRARRSIPGVRFDDAAGAIRGMKRSKLIVIDHPGTSLLQALAMNAPTVAFWDPAHCPMRSEAEPYFTLLREAGILYDSADAAARQVNQVGPAPLDWWMSPAVQRARKKFCRRFAWADPNWKRIWAAALSSYHKSAVLGERDSK